MGCRINGCTKNGIFYDGYHGDIIFVKKDLCSRHLYRLNKYGDPEAKTRFDPRPPIIEGDIAKIPLGVNAKNGYAIVDKEFAYLANEKLWCTSASGYAVSRGHFLHHMVMGKPEKGKVIDHINGDKLLNTRSNLRVVTQQENSMNYPAKKGTSKYKGVHRQKNRWRASLQKDGKRVYGKLFKTEEEAAAAYNTAALKYFGEVAYRNEIK